MKPKIYVNVPNSQTDGSRKVYCPLCYYDLREVPMVFSDISQSWICNYCKYVMSKQQNPVGDSQITAGNDTNTSAPYMRAVKFTRKAPPVGKTDTFNTAAQAWAAD